MKVAIRVDGSWDIGSGHLVRCATLAKGLREHGAEIIFLCRKLDSRSCEFLESKGLSVAYLDIRAGATTLRRHDDIPDVEWDGSIQQGDCLASSHILSRQGSVDWLVIDHYGIDIRWESRMRDFASHIMVIDDLANRKHDCDVLLNQNVCSQNENR